MVEVFAIRLIKEDDYQKFRMKLLSLIPESMIQKIEKFKRSDDEQRSLLGEILARKVLSQKSGINAKDLEIIKSEKGKPKLINIPNLHFNISHSGNWVVCAVDPERVGIDIEKIKEPQYRIAERYFSKSEWDSLNNLSGKEKQESFFDLWTLKESYLKMLGKGLTKPLGSFTISKNEDGFVLNENSGKTKEVFLNQYHIETGYKLSVCSENKSYKSQVKILEIKELLEKNEAKN